MPHTHTHTKKNSWWAVSSWLVPTMVSTQASNKVELIPVFTCKIKHGLPKTTIQLLQPTNFVLFHTPHSNGHVAHNRRQCIGDENFIALFSSSGFKICLHVNVTGGGIFLHLWLICVYNSWDCMSLSYEKTSYLIFHDCTCWSLMTGTSGCEIS